MENYNDSFYSGGGDPVTLNNPLIHFAQDHPVTTLIFAIIGVIAIIILVVYLVSLMYGVMFGTSDSFVGSYMHWRPNVQTDRSLTQFNANQSAPPLQFPIGLLKNGVDADGVETNLGSY